MKRGDEAVEKLQLLAGEVQRAVDAWEKLDSASLSAKVGQKLEELAQLETLLKSKPRTYNKLEMEQLQNLRSMLHHLLKDRGLEPHERIERNPSASHAGKADQTYRAIKCKYDDNRRLLQTLLQTKSPREHTSPSNEQADRALKYRQKYEKLKHQYNELLQVAKCMEQQIASLQKQLQHHRKLHGESSKSLQELRVDNCHLRKQLTLLQADQLNKDTELKELRRELEIKQKLCFDRNFLEERLSKYDDLVMKLKIEYEREAGCAVRLQDQLRVKYDALLAQNHKVQEQYSRLAIKHQKLNLDYGRRERQCLQLQQYEAELRKLEAEVLVLRQQLQARQIGERERVKSIQLINSRVESQRRANIELQQQLVTSMREKKELIYHLQDQRQLKKDIEQIATVVDTLKKQNQELRSNMVRSPRSDTKLKVISELQDMVRLHKLQLKDSRRS